MTPVVVTMSKRSTKLSNDISISTRGQRGITAIETSIVLIAFVIVGSVFAFTVLNTGLISSEKGKETVNAGVEEASASLALRGGVIAAGNAGKTGIDTIKFYLTPAAQSAGSVDFSTSRTVVTYLDSNDSLNCTAGGTGSCSWTANWVIGSGDQIDPGERVEMTITLKGMTPPLLGKNTEFTIQVRPSKGAVVVINRTIPGQVKAVMDLY